MSWQKIESMPCVLEIIKRAEKEITEKTGVVVTLNTWYGNEDRLKEMVKDHVCTYFKVQWKEIEGPTRKAEVVNARHAYMYIMVKVFKYTLKEVGKDCGHRDYTTVISAITKVVGYFHVGVSLADDIRNVLKNLPIKKADEL